jgi:hypothetical protein
METLLNTTVRECADIPQATLTIYLLALGYTPGQIRQAYRAYALGY